MATVIITGANGNLGRAVTDAFLSKGYQVVASVMSEHMLAEMPTHNMLDTRVVDLGKESAANEFVGDAVSRYGSIEGALLLVGGFAMGSMANTEMTLIQQQIDLNFKTAYHVARPLFRHMKENNKGRIVFIGARPALEAAQGKDLLAYGLSKSLLFKLAEYMNAEAKGSNVTATVVAPSTLDTPLNRKSMPETDPAIWVKPSALAEILEFIVSEKANPLRESIFKVYHNA